MFTFLQDSDEEELPYVEAPRDKAPVKPAAPQRPTAPSRPTTGPKIGPLRPPPAQVAKPELVDFDPLQQDTQSKQIRSGPAKPPPPSGPTKPPPPSRPSNQPTRPSAPSKVQHVKNAIVDVSINLSC